MTEKLIGPVFQGETSVKITAVTLRRIVNDWLHVNVSGGPYEVTGIEQDKSGYGDTGFTVKFRDVVPAEPTVTP